LTVILHTLNASPSSSAFDDSLKVIQSGDAVVLMGDGVYAALAGTKVWGELQARGAELYLLSSDALAAGVTEPSGGGANFIDMDGFVSLTERFPRQQAWY
jgi:tRNA 2-thiouridine synthesizing protein B